METYGYNMEKMQPVPDAPPMYTHTQYPQESVLHANNLQFSQNTPLEQLRPATSRPQTSRPETANAIVVNLNPPLAVGHEPQRLTCPHCGVMMITRLDFRSTFRTHIFALVLCVTGLWCCAPLPYCMKTCKSLDHHCSNCDQFIGNTKV